jgi:predicted secreted protein
MINLFARNPVHFILIIVLRNSKNKKVQNEKWRSLLKRATIDLHEHKEVNEEDRMSQDYNRFIILFIMEYVDCIYSSLFMNVCY